MDEKNIRKYAELMREFGLTGVEVSENGCTVRLERTSLPATTDIVQETPAPIQIQEPVPVKDPGLTEVCSPMVGVFYSSPAENAEPFVKVGTHVQRGDVLCIIEAMKLMNELTAEEDGTIEEICTEDSQVVDFGHVLFRMRKD